MIHGVQLAEAVQPLVEELAELDSRISLLADNESAIRAFDASSGGWRNRHLRMRAHAARERVAANLLKVSHLPGELQIADLGTKPLPRPRIFRLLDLANIRIRVLHGDVAKDARLLSRLCLTGGQSGIDLAKTVAGLALLAVLPRVKAQPFEGRLEVGTEGLFWVVGVLVAVLLGLWGWWWLYGPVAVVPTANVSDSPEEDPDPVHTASGGGALEKVEGRGSSSEEFGGSSGSGIPVDGQVDSASAGDQAPASVGKDQDDDDEFTEAEYEEVRKKLERQERFTGLTFVQRSRLRKALIRGDLVEPPVFQQRYGAPPEWLVGPPEEASYDAQEPSDSTGQIRGSSSAQEPSDSSGQIRGSSSAQEPSDSSGQIRGSSSAQEPSDSSGQIRGSSSAQEPSDSSGQIRGSSVAQEPSDFSGQIRGSSEGQTLAGGAGRQASGSGSDAGVAAYPLFNFQEGGSSGSQGMQAPPVQGVCYEDYFGEDLLLDEFPYVGSWLRTHFLMRVLSEAGEMVLWALGNRAEEWRQLRCASEGLRYALALTVVGVLRRGPWSVMFSQPQWLEAVEEYILTGYPYPKRDLSITEPGHVQEPLASSHSFPYVEGPPGVVVHYLWRVFLLIGWSVLDFLGIRVASHSRLRATARGFRHSSTLALSVWLRRTHHLHIATTQETFDAALAYWQSGEIRYPFEERENGDDVEDDEELDERPLRPRVPGLVARFGPAGQALLEVQSSSSETEDSEDSTTEPSEVSGGLGESSSEAGGTQVQDSEGGLGSPGDYSGGLTYAAAEGGLMCTYLDDTVVEPLPGWSLEDVQTIVQGLQTGDWARFQTVIAESLERVEGSEEVELPSGSADVPRRRKVATGLGGGRSRRPVGIILLWLLWFWWGGIKAVSGVSVEPWGPLEDQCLESTSQQVVLFNPQVQDVDEPCEEGVVCDGSWLWGLSKVCLIVLTWEIGKRLAVVRTGRSSSRAEVACQTGSMNVVPLPLGDDVPYRARILFCFWRAGLQIDIEPYKERVKSEFYWLVGDYLQKVESGWVSESDSD